MKKSGAVTIIQYYTRNFYEWNFFLPNIISLSKYFFKICDPLPNWNLFAANFVPIINFYGIFCRKYDLGSADTVNYCSTISKFYGKLPLLTWKLFMPIWVSNSFWVFDSYTQKRYIFFTDIDWHIDIVFLKKKNI